MWREKMKRKTDLSLDLFGDRLDVSRRNADDDGEYKRMLHVLRRAMEGELTERQRECVQLRYLNGKSVNEVAAELGVTASTASKHLKKARKRLGTVMGYSFSRLN
jgi:RNA polymerase sigma factor (sigma-70 family)